MVKPSQLPTRTDKNIQSNILILNLLDCNLTINELRVQKWPKHLSSIFVSVSKRFISSPLVILSSFRREVKLVPNELFRNRDISQYFSKLEKICKFPFCHDFEENFNSNKMSCFEIVTFLNPLFWWIVTFDPRENKSWPWDNLSLKWMRGKWILKNKYIHTKSVSNHYSYSQGIKLAALTNSKIWAWNILNHNFWVIIYDS